MIEAGREANVVLSTLESLLEGAQIIDRDWRYVYLNPAAAAHGGRTVEELTGRSMVEAYPGIDETPMFAVLKRAMTERVPATMDNEFVAPDGARKWFHLLIQPVPEGLFILSLDVSEQKRAESALQKSRARFEAVVEHLQEGLILSDLQGNMLHWNHAALKMLGFTDVEKARGSIADFAHLFRIFALDGTPLEPHERPLARVLAGEELNDVELKVTRVGQAWERIFSYSGSTVQYAGSETLAFVTIRDVTARKDLERQFVRAQRMESIGNLASGIAHDLNNVLMPILFGATALRRLDVEKRHSNTLDNIERSAKRGADLVRQVLSFARGLSRDDWKTVGLREVVRDVESIVRGTFPKNIAFHIDISEDVHHVSGDATQLLQVVLNLCVNARDAMPGGGRLRISARNVPVSEQTARAHRVNPGHYVELIVADDGMGMSPEVIGHIFDADFTTKAPGKGTGLGLFTVKDIVRSHAGFVEVFSEPGKGTTFRILLPASFGSPLALAEPDADITDLPRGNGEVILIVDDEVSILAVAEGALTAFGYEVLTADDGANALAVFAANRHRIALVVTDMMMPVLDGAAAITTMLRMNPELPVIATSGTSSEDWLLRAERAGAKFFLTKPYTAPTLLRMVADIVAARRN